MDIEEIIYRKEQDRCGIKQGDKVRVLRIAKSNERGWHNSWVETMDDTVGKVLTVDYIYVGNNGIGLSNKLSYPYFVLEKV